jgi:hypothetical protein
MKTRIPFTLGAAVLVLVSCPIAFGADAPTKTARPAIYNEDADGGKQIAEALTVAKKENKRVLLQFGANWYGWCHKLHKLCESDVEIAAKLMARTTGVADTVIEAGHSNGLFHRPRAPTPCRAPSPPPASAGGWGWPARPAPHATGSHPRLTGTRKDGSVTQTILAAGFWVNIVTDVNDNDEVYMETQGEGFLFAASKPVWFEAKVKLTEANTAVHLASRAPIHFLSPQVNLSPYGRQPLVARTTPVYNRVTFCSCPLSTAQKEL